MFLLIIYKPSGVHTHNLSAVSSLASNTLRSFLNKLLLPAIIKVLPVMVVLIYESPLVVDT